MKVDMWGVEKGGVSEKLMWRVFWGGVWEEQN